MLTSFNYYCTKFIVPEKEVNLFMEKNSKIDSNKSKRDDFENLDREEIKKEYDDMVNENFFSATFAHIGEKFGSKIDSFAKAGRNAKKKLKSTFSKENMRSVGNKIKYVASKEGLKDAGRKIYGVGSSIKTKALELKMISKMESFYVSSLEKILKSYDGSSDNDDFLYKIKESLSESYLTDVEQSVKKWLGKDRSSDIENSETNLGKKFAEGKEKLDKFQQKLNFEILQKIILSYNKKIGIKILRQAKCKEALTKHLINYGTMDPLWDIFTSGSKTIRKSVLKSKEISLLPTMVDSLLNCSNSMDNMNVGVYSNTLMSYLLKNFKGKGRNKSPEWKLKCGLLLIKYSKEDGEYFSSLDKLVTERTNKIIKNKNLSGAVVKKNNLKSIKDVLDFAAGSKKGTASIAIGAGINYNHADAMNALEKVYISLGKDKSDVPKIIGATVLQLANVTEKAVGLKDGSVPEIAETSQENEKVTYSEWLSEVNTLFSRLKEIESDKKLQEIEKNLKKNPSTSKEREYCNDFLDELKSISEKLKSYGSYSKEFDSKNEYSKAFNKNSQKINKLMEKIEPMIISPYDTDREYQKWYDSISEINNMAFDFKNHKSLKTFNNIQEFNKYMRTDYKEDVKKRCGEMLKKYKPSIEELKKDLDKYSIDEYDPKNKQKFEKAELKIQTLNNVLNDSFIEEEIAREVKDECKQWLNQVDKSLKPISTKLPSEDDSKNQPITESEKQKYEQIIEEQEHKFKDYSNFLKEISDETLNERMNNASKYIESYKQRVENAKIEEIKEQGS